MVISFQLPRCAGVLVPLLLLLARPGHARVCRGVEGGGTPGLAGHTRGKGAWQGADPTTAWEPLHLVNKAPQPKGAQEGRAAGVQSADCSAPVSS